MISGTLKIKTEVSKGYSIRRIVLVTNNGDEVIPSSEVSILINKMMLYSLAKPGEYIMIDEEAIKNTAI